ncbi:hypothetical protein Hypma_015442 [Hypsizygus marmoreus]|uniref:Uncharacterized protein n=1 Tax=Hypsizygus marmoreus TaxID=39966 RepID=A0A369K9X6_HYPMA|nr:hypothetical protein Hypma_015442 [Hypsizygus marmoreus]
MKAREYCCCAIPIVNAGIYIALTEQFVTAFIVGILSVATPSIVGAATPSYSKWILAAICFIVAAIQILGFIGVAREKPTLYRRYVTLHMLATLAAFAVAAAWAIISATRHTTAKTKCLTDFFQTSSEGDTLCEIFPWVDIGIMGGLWVVLAILHIYLYIILSSYGSSQRRDHEKYDQLNNDSIPMNKRNDPWDSRPSADSVLSPRDGHNYNHLRQESGTSVSDMLAQPQVQPKDSLSNTDYAYQQSSYPPPSRKLSRGGASMYNPHARDDTLTPQYDAYYGSRVPQGYPGGA